MNGEPQISRDEVGPGEEWLRGVYDQALPVVYGYFLRRCSGRVEDAEELTQATFESALRALRSGTVVQAPLPWIVSIARRRLIDYYRSQASIRRRLQRIVSHTDKSWWQISEAATSAAEARLITALNQVPPRQRLAVVLRYVDDLALKEVARLLRTTEKAAESLLSRGRRSLRSAYEETDDR